MSNNLIKKVRLRLKKVFCPPKVVWACCCQVADACLCYFFSGRALKARFWSFS